MKPKIYNLADTKDLEEVASKLWYITVGFVQSWKACIIKRDLWEGAVFCFNALTFDNDACTVKYSQKENYLMVDWRHKNMGDTMRLCLIKFGKGSYKWTFSNKMYIINSDGERFNSVTIVPHYMYYYPNSNYERDIILHRKCITLEEPLILDYYGIRLYDVHKPGSITVGTTDPHWCRAYKKEDSTSAILFYDENIHIHLADREKVHKKKKETKRMKEWKKIYFYEVSPSAADNVLTMYNETKNAIRAGVSSIRTTQMCFLSTELIENGYDVCIVDHRGFNEIEYGKFGDLTIDKNSDLFALWKGGFLSRDSYTICRRITRQKLENKDSGAFIGYRSLKKKLEEQGVDGPEACEAIKSVVMSLFQEGDILFASSATR